MIVRIVTRIAAPITRCFDLSRSIDLHTRSAAQTDERAIAGVMKGLIGLGEEVTWRGRHFGLWLTMTSRITALDRPSHFRDEMVKGLFAHFRHDHDFAEASGGTLMTDTLDFASPVMGLGALVDRLMMKRYFAKFLQTRNAILLRAAESDEWKEFVEG